MKVVLLARRSKGIIIKFVTNVDNHVTVTRQRVHDWNEKVDFRHN